MIEGKTAQVVEWKSLKPDSNDVYIVRANDTITHAVWNDSEGLIGLIAMGFTHYLTEADLLKLPFQQ